MTGKRQKPPAGSPLSERDLKDFARLVKKYPGTQWSDIAQTIELPGDPGRPSGGEVVKYAQLIEAVFLQRLFEEALEQVDTGNRRKDTHEAELKMYRKLFNQSVERKPDHFTKWQKTTRNKRTTGRRVLRLMREAEEVGMLPKGYFTHITGGPRLFSLLHLREAFEAAKKNTVARGAPKSDPGQFFRRAWGGALPPFQAALFRIVFGLK